MKNTYLFIFFLLFSLFSYSQTSFELQKLKDFAKLYGIVRYFHPSDEAAELDWYAFGAYGVEEILKTKNLQEFEKKLKELFIPIAPSLSFEGKKYHWDTLNLYPVYWVHNGLGLGSIPYKGIKTYFSNRFNKDTLDSLKRGPVNTNPYYTLNLSNNLTITIPIIVYTNGNHTLPVIDSLHFNQMVKNINKVYLTDFDRNISLVNIIIIWNIFRHFYPYQKEIEINWNKILESGLKEAYSNKTENDHLLTLRKFTAVFQDGHIKISNSKIKDLDDYALPVSWKWIDNQLVVNKIMNSVKGIEKGDIIQKINGQTVKNYMDSTGQYISGSKQWRQWAALQEGLKGSKGSKITLLFNDGKKIELSREYLYQKNHNFYSREDTIMFKELKSNILYLNLDKITKYQFYQQYDKIKSFHKIILDLRGYPNKGVREMLTNFFPNKFFNDVFFKPLIKEPELRGVEWKGGRWLYKLTDSLQAKIVLLVDERCISYAESVTSYLKENKYVTILGHSTAGANGNVNRIKLADNFFMTFTGMKVKNPDGSQFFTIGVQPDIYIDYTIEGIKQGKDPFIEKAVEVLNK